MGKLLVVCATVVIVAAIVSTGGSTGAPGIVIASEIRIQDKEGKTRIWLRVRPSGEPSIEMRDSKGVTRVALNTQSIQIFKKSGSQGSSLSHTDEGGGLTIRGEKGLDVSVAARRGLAGVTATHGTGRTALVLTDKKAVLQLVKAAEAIELETPEGRGVVPDFTFLRGGRQRWALEAK